MAKTVPISVRVSYEDAEFIADLQIDNAVTPSDKVRSIIREAKQQKEKTVNYDGCLKLARESLRNLTQKVKAAELEQKQYSELVNVFSDWTAESFAYLASATYQNDEGTLDLTQLEQAISERVFRLVAIVARMGVTAKAPCYDKEIINAGFVSILELIQIINQRIEREK